MNLRHFFFLALIAGCDSSPSDVLRDVEVRTSATTYRTEEIISVEVVNETDWDAFFYHCNHRFAFTVEEQKSGSWVEAMNLNGPACLGIFPSGVEVLTPGSMKIESFTLSKPGRYRLRFPTGTRSTEIGAFLATSNEFTVQ